MMPIDRATLLSDNLICSLKFSSLSKYTPKYFTLLTALIEKWLFIMCPDCQYMFLFNLGGTMSMQVLEIFMVSSLTEHQT